MNETQAKVFMIPLVTLIIEKITYGGKSCHTPENFYLQLLSGRCPKVELVRQSFDAVCRRNFDTPVVASHPAT